MANLEKLKLAQEYFGLLTRFSDASPAAVGKDGSSVVDLRHFPPEAKEKLLTLSDNPQEFQIVPIIIQPDHFPDSKRISSKPVEMVFWNFYCLLEAAYPASLALQEFINELGVLLGENPQAVVREADESSIEIDKYHPIVFWTQCFWSNYKISVKAQELGNDKLKLSWRDGDIANYLIKKEEMKKKSKRLTVRKPERT